MDTNCVPRCGCSIERDFIMSFSDEKQADIINAFNNALRYLQDILNIFK